MLDKSVGGFWESYTEGEEAQQGYANLIEDNAEDEDVLF